MRRTGKPNRRVVSLAAAVSLLLQSILFAWSLAGGAHGAPMLDAFGNPLCITSTHSDQAPGAPVDGRHLSCCTLACGASALLGVEPPAGPVLAAPLSTALDVVRPRIDSAGPPAERRTANPRAPPARLTRV